MLKKSFFSLAVLGSVMLVGCASQPTVSSSRYQRVPETYTVRSGDSLSKIARRYNLDYSDIARMNNIAVMDKIYVGQKIRLKAGASSSQQVAQPYPVAQPIVTERQTLAQQAQSQTIPVANNSVIPVVPSNPTATQTAVAQSSWVLPSRGQIVQKFDLSQDRKGMYYAGNLGDPVFAASAGEVVYADDGLKEYGNLILLRHSKGYISAYAHNSKLLVKVGDQVQAGQTIAEVGNSGTNRIWLQFQIRLNGKPIDPATLLPSS